MDAEKTGALVFHAGTAEKDGRLLATGGRVLNVTGFGNTVTEAQKAAYKAVEAIKWDNGFCRRDIGWRAVEREKAGITCEILRSAANGRVRIIAINRIGRRNAVDLADGKRTFYKRLANLILTKILMWQS